MDSTDRDPIQSSAGVRDLRDVACLLASGPDARAWLNGQITQQLAFLEPGRAAYGLAVNVKGRILSDLWVSTTTHDALRIAVPADRRDALRTHLAKYIVMEDVELSDDDRAIVTVQGPAAAAITRDLPGCEVLAAPRLHPDGRDVVCAPGDREAVSALLTSRATELGGGPIDDAAWALAHVRRGIPRYGVDFDESSYPQEAGLEDRAVSFEKGCYLGQEVVCMLQNRGQLRRRLVQLHAEGPLEVGGELAKDDAALGAVTSAAPDPSGGWVALGYVKRASAEIGARLDRPAPCSIVAIVGDATK
ncbi:MAG: folate-binding protein YgfZ [Sandaracinaceae bacterium]